MKGALWPYSYSSSSLGESQDKAVQVLDTGKILLMLIFPRCVQITFSSHQLFLQLQLSNHFEAEKK